MNSTLADRNVLFDARWLGIGGPGRVTEHMLMGLARLRPPGTWLLWGNSEVIPYLWDGARHLPSKHHPHALFGQREFPGPRGIGADIAFFPHQMRPAWRIARAEVTTIHDTIPFRYPPNPKLRQPMKVYLRRIAAVSDLVVTDSEFSLSTVSADLHIPTSRIRVLPISVDHEAADRVRALRLSRNPSRSALYLGADLPHKNLDRLLQAFARTAFQDEGGQLLLIGMDQASCDRLTAVARATGARATALGHVSGERLVELLADARLVVQPSLEEGFGLPVAEAMAAGIPVAASSGGSLPEITRGAINHFDPEDIAAMSAAIDDAANRTAQPDLDWPTPDDLANAVIQACVDASRLLATSRS